MIENITEDERKIIDYFPSLESKNLIFKNFIQRLRVHLAEII